MIETKPVPRVESVEKKIFLKNYKKNNQPVVIENLTRDWPARKLWTLDYFKQIIGDNIVPLYNSQPAQNRQHQHAPSAQMSLTNYIDMLEQGENELRLFFYNLLASNSKLVKDFEYPDIGLHFFKKLPVLFLGGKGAKVQMHFDIDLADIFLCHFGGKKRVLLVSPEQGQFMYRVPFSFSSLFDVNFEQPDYVKYPALKNLKGELAELNHGDILYIPPGYWHYIFYEDISFSMALRAFPRTPKNFTKMLRNLAVIRVIDGLMRKLMGQAWNDRNERLAITNTHKQLGIL